MKSILSIAIATIILHSSLALSELEIPLSNLLGNFRPGHSLRFSDISDQCKAETEKLVTNSGLVAATSAFDNCPIQSDGNSVTVNFGSCPATGKFQLACTSAGGKYTTVSYHISCRANGKRVSVFANDAPECIGQSCSDSIKDESVQKELANAFEQGLKAQGISASCNPAPAMVI